MGALLPLALFALGIVFVTISGMITIRAYFGPLVLVIGMVILLAKDRTAACEAMLSGVADRTLAVMIMAFLGAGVLGQILVTLMCPLTAGNTPAMLFCGPVVKDIGKKFQIHRTRRANLMDLAGNGVTENLPQISTILALAGAMAASSETTGAPLVPILLVGALAFIP